MTIDPVDTRAAAVPVSTGRALLPAVPVPLLRGHDLDSRLQKPKMTLDGSLERMYCVSCGAASGWVTTEVVTIATYVCPACTAAFGPLSLPKIEIPE